MKAEASILQRIGELQKEGMWSDKRLPKVREPDRKKSHWDYVLEEASWMQMDFIQERKWKQAASRRVCVHPYLLFLAVVSSLSYWL